MSSSFSIATLLGVVFVATVASVLVASIVLLIVGKRFPKWAKILLIILLVVSAVILAIVALVVMLMGRAHAPALPVQY